MHILLMHQLINAEAIDCTMCYRDEQPPRSEHYVVLPAGLCGQLYTDEEQLVVPQYACQTSCTRLFFSGGGSAGQDSNSPLPTLQSPSLVVCVLAPLLWLPFAVYANNEVAQLIDGVWFQHTNGPKSTAGTSSSVRIGLSTTSQGYYTIAPLIHAVTIACAGIVSVFVWSSGGYVVEPPSRLRATHEGAVAQEALEKACLAVTIGTVLLNLVMLLRVLVEVVSSLREGQSDESDGAGSLNAPLLDRPHRSDAGGVHLQPEPEPQPEGSGAEDSAEAAQEGEAWSARGSILAIRRVLPGGVAERGNGTRVDLAGSE